MARRSRRAKDPVARAATVALYPFRVKSKVDAFLRPAARIAGAIGIAMLVACGFLWRTPAEQWPQWLDPSHLAIYAMISLAVASLLGWTFVHDGQTRIKRAIGKPLSLCAFVVLPISFTIAGLIGAADLEAIGGPPGAHWFWNLVHWYGPMLVVVSLLAFLTWKSRGRYARGLWFALLVAPYAALLAYLVFGLRLPGIDDAHHTTLRSLGSWAITLQLALCRVVG